MISLCCCAINAKWDVELLVRLLNLHTDPSTFEIVLTHDDRVNDGSSSYFKNLQQQFKNFKVVTHTYDDTALYLERLMDYYDRMNIFEGKIRSALRNNVAKFKARDFYNERAFLWISSGILYNKAVEASSGDVLLIMPADFFPLFGLQDLELFVKSNSRHGDYYASPHALFAHVSNQDEEWLKSHVEQIHNGTYQTERGRWETRECFKDYLRCPPNLDQTYIIDAQQNRIIALSSPTWLEEMWDFTLRRTTFHINGFHGFHVLTRQTFDRIGGFTEEWFDRAFADDKMTYKGGVYGCGNEFWKQFSICWCGQYEVNTQRGIYAPTNWRETLKKVDPLADHHPIPGMGSPVYLHRDIVSGSAMIELQRQYFKSDAPIVRFS